MGEVNILVQIDFEPERLDEIRSIVNAFHEKIMQGNGPIYMHIMENVDNPGQIFFVERWRSMEDFQRHIGSPHFNIFGEAIKDKANMCIHKLNPLDCS